MFLSLKEKLLLIMFVIITVLYVIIAVVIIILIMIFISTFEISLPGQQLMCFVDTDFFLVNLDENCTSAETVYCRTKEH